MLSLSGHGGGRVPRDMIIDRVVTAPTVDVVNRSGRLRAALIPIAIDRYIIVDIDLRSNRQRLSVQLRTAGTKRDVHPGRQRVIAEASISSVAIASAAISVLRCPDAGTADISRGTIPPCVCVRDSGKEYH